MSIYVLSNRGLNSSVSNDPLFALEDLLVQTCDGQLLIPTPREITRWLHERRRHSAPLLKKIIRRTKGFYNPLDDFPRSPDKPNVLVAIVQHGANLEILSSIPNWRERFDLVVAYVFDAWAPEIYPQYARQIDHLFVPMPEIIDTLQNYFGIPVSLLPFGADVLTHSSGSLNRPFDLMSYGRIPREFDRKFAEKFNQPDSERIYYRSTPRRSEDFPKASYEDRRDREDTMLLFHILRRTKLALAFDTMYPGMREFPHSFVTLRWFDCTATGCAVIGKRPTTPLADELLCWEDSTIELPDDPQESIEFIEELLKDTPRLNAIHKRNYTESLARHDWRLRIKNMFEVLDLPLPDRLVDELSQLKKIHDEQMKMQPV
jgi:hypothetical protein